MKGTLTLAKVAGIRISVHWTFLILIIWILFSGGKTGNAVWNVAFVLTIFLCVALHELGHALMALRFGIITRDITLLPIGGVARLEKIPEKPNQELAVAIAGPLVNVAIAAALYLFVRDSLHPDAAQNLSSVGRENFLTALFTVNISLAVFNLLPAFPMDGGRMLRALLAFRLNRVKATRIAANIGQLMAMLFGLVGLMYNPFLLFIAIFVFFGAQMEWQAVESKSFLEGHRVKEVTIRQFPSLQSSDTLANAIDILLQGQAHDFVVFKGDEIVGTLGRTEIIKGLSEKGKDTAVNEVMSRDVQTTPPDASLEEIYEKMQRSRLPLMLVTEGQRLVGVVDLENILEFIMLQKAQTHG